MRKEKEKKEVGEGGGKRNEKNSYKRIRGRREISARQSERMKKQRKYKR